MKKILAAVAAAIAFGTLGVPTAEARPLTDGEQAYINELYYDGLGEYNAGEALLLGYMACASPLTPAQQVDVVYANTTIGIDYEDAMSIVVAAHDELCPGGVLA